MNYLSLLKKIIILYLILTFLEWFNHNIIMHGDPNKLKKIPLIGAYLKKIAILHTNHHKEVEMNMDINELYDNNDRGMHFSWNTLPAMFLQFFSVLSLFNLFESVKINIIVSLIVAFSYGLIWNTIHPIMHKYEMNVKWNNGIPNIKNIEPNNFIYKWLLKHHALHHYQKDNKGNFNILIPGFDFIIGTHYSNCYDNTEYCKRTNDSKVCKNKDLIKKCISVDDF